MLTMLRHTSSYIVIHRRRRRRRHCDKVIIRNYYRYRPPYHRSIIQQPQTRYSS